MFSMDERSLIDNPITLVMNEPMFSMDERSLIDNPITLVMNEPMFSMDERSLVTKAVFQSAIAPPNCDKLRLPLY